jgi:putative DNA-invertase from lambdoid prophage Rac
MVSIPCTNARPIAANFELSDGLSGHLASQGVYGGGKRPFGYDVIDGRLVANASEQALLARMKAMRDDGETYRTIGAKFSRDPKTIQRILERTKV